MSNARRLLMPQVDGEAPVWSAGLEIAELKDLIKISVPLVDENHRFRCQRLTGRTLSETIGDNLVITARVGIPIRAVPVGGTAEGGRYGSGTRTVGSTTRAH